MKPDECLFKAHLGEAPFQSGADAGKWGLHDEVAQIVWPHPILWVDGAKTIVPAGRVYLRFTADGYSALAPTACPWSAEKNARLENGLWPKIPGKFAKVFRLDWNNGTALYAPCDRVAMSDHQQWKHQFPSWWWQPHFTIVKYLRIVHQCLNPLHHENEPT
jgi:hypothetical protein